jgi:uncharacterized protein (TIGR03083 family)
MSPLDFATEFLTENRAFSELFRDADGATPVPTCPGWSLDQVFRHVGLGHRWSAQIVRDHLQEFLDLGSVEAGKPPPGQAEAISWMHGGAQLLVDAVQLTGSETPVWTLVGSRRANWWIRRRLHETAMHRADAALVLGADFALTPQVAADGITERLELIAFQAGADGAALPLADGTTLHLHATDAGLGEAGEWTIAVDQGRIAWLHEHSKGSVALRGGAAELLLAMTRRTDVGDTGIELFGDDAVWQNWLQRTPY